MTVSIWPPILEQAEEAAAERARPTTPPAMITAPI